MEPLQTVALDMIDTFIQGDTDEYRNNVLNQEVYNHESTQIYLSGVIFSLNSLINDYNGDIAALKYDTNNTRDRKEHPFVEKLEELKIFEPVYNSEWDKVNGFAFCLHGLWGNKVEVTSFIIDDIKKTYTGFLKVTLYDHFGLDFTDIQKYHLYGGFVSWYLLQHNDRYNKAYKPFITLVEISVPFSGYYQ